MPAAPLSLVVTTRHHCQLSPGRQNRPQSRTTGVSNLKGTLRRVLLKENVIYVNLQETQASVGLFYAQLARKKKPVAHIEVHPGQSREKTIARE